MFLSTGVFHTGFFDRSVHTGNGFTIKRIITSAGLDSALGLAEEVFMRFEAPGFSERGVESFRSFLWGTRLREMFRRGEMAVWGCYKDDELAGMMALRGGEHISLAFVRADFHRQGIGRALFREIKKYALRRGRKRITVNASDYGIPFYRAMGFAEVGTRTVTDGVEYTPMAAEIRKDTKNA